MNLSCMRKTFLIGLVTCASASSLADEKPFDAAIEARQGYMRVLGYYINLLAEMAKGNQPYDAALATMAAHNLYQATKLDNAAMWPFGSDNGNPDYAQKTNALPELWQDYEKLDVANEEWKQASEDFATEAGKGLDALRTAIVPMGESCQNCHDLALDE